MLAPLLRVKGVPSNSDTRATEIRQHWPRQTMMYGSPNPIASNTWKDSLSHWPPENANSNHSKILPYTHGLSKMKRNGNIAASGIQNTRILIYFVGGGVNWGNHLKKLFGSTFQIKCVYVMHQFYSLKYMYNNKYIYICMKK